MFFNYIDDEYQQNHHKMFIFIEGFHLPTVVGKCMLKNTNRNIDKIKKINIKTM